MIKFYYHPSPNPAKVALFLEETGLPYELMPVDTRKGEQFSAAFSAINPNHKTPAIDDDGTVVFDSNAILLYLADKTGRFLPSSQTDATRGPLLSWLMFVASGIGPYAGQAVHFNHFAPEKLPYAIKRYDHEAHRHFAILETRLGQHRYMLGDDYTIVDMALWGWMGVLPYVFGPKGWDERPNLKRLYDEINARPAAARANELKTRHAFKAELDGEARRHLFPHATTA